MYERNSDDEGGDCPGEVGGFGVFAVAGGGVATLSAGFEGSSGGVFDETG